MSQPAAEIKTTLRVMLAEANRRKSSLTNWLYGLGLLFGLFMIGWIYDLLANGLGFGGFMAGLLGCAGGVAAVFPFVMLEEKITGWRVRALADEFRSMFPKDPGDYATALALLKSAKSESQVEKNLIQALDEDIVLGEAPGALLGALDGIKKAAGGNSAPKTAEPAPATETPARSEPRPDYMPLDPMGAERGGQEP